MTAITNFFSPFFLFTLDVHFFCLWYHFVGGIPIHIWEYLTNISFVQIAQESNHAYFSNQLLLWIAKLGDVGKRRILLPVYSAVNTEDFGSQLIILSSSSYCYNAVMSTFSWTQLSKVGLLVLAPFSLVYPFPAPEPSQWDGFFLCLPLNSYLRAASQTTRC